MSPKLNAAVAVIGIDIGKNSFHVVGLDRHRAIVLRQKRWMRKLSTFLMNQTQQLPASTLRLDLSYSQRGRKPIQPHSCHRPRGTARIDLDQDTSWPKVDILNLF